MEDDCLDQLVIEEMQYTAEIPACNLRMQVINIFKQTYCDRGVTFRVIYSIYGRSYDILM